MQQNVPFDLLSRLRHVLFAPLPIQGTSTHSPPINDMNSSRNICNDASFGPGVHGPECRGGFDFTGSVPLLGIPNALCD